LKVAGDPDMRYLDAAARIPVAVWLDDNRMDCNDDTLDEPESLAVWASPDGWVELTVPVECGEGVTDDYGCAITGGLTVRFPQWLIPRQLAPTPTQSGVDIDVGYELICKRSDDAPANVE
jgi:hypothetical protein